MSPIDMVPPVEHQVSHCPDLAERCVCVRMYCNHARLQKCRIVLRESVQRLWHYYEYWINDKTCLHYYTHNNNNNNRLLFYVKKYDKCQILKESSALSMVDDSSWESLSRGSFYLKGLMTTDYLQGRALLLGGSSGWELLGNRIVF